MFIILTFMMDHIMNLMNKSYYKCERGENTIHSPCYFLRITQLIDRG